MTTQTENQIEKEISREEFNQLPLTTKLNEILEFFKKNKDKAFHFNILMENLNLSKSQLYVQLKVLINSKQVERRGMYYILK